MIVLYLSDQWAHTTKSFIASANKRAYFAETVLSFVHALVTSIIGLLQFILDNTTTRTLYSYLANLSCAYFVVHGLNYLSFQERKDIILVFHHLLSFLVVVPITNLNGYYLTASECSNVVYFVSAGFHLVEFSTIFLDTRIFSKFWNNKKYFYMSSIGLIATYFPLRCIWVSYLMTVIWQYQAQFNTCFGPSALFILLGAFGFIVLMSLCYFIIMLQSGSRLFHLTHYKKDC